MERRKEREKKGRREREELPKRVRNCGKSRLYLETAALYIISVGFPMQNPKRKENKVTSCADWPAGGAIAAPLQTDLWINKTSSPSNKSRFSI